VRRAPVARVAVVGLAILVTGCSSALPVPPPDPPPTGAAAYACAAMRGRLPDEVDGATVTAVKPQSPYTSAWGSPAIVLRCGVGIPHVLAPTSQLLVVDGVSWLPEQLTQGYVFTTVGLAVNVEVSVPDHYAPEADALADITPAIVAVVPSASPDPASSPSSS
jgi:hypothetical protein